MTRIRGLPSTETIIGDGGTGCIEGWGGNGIEQVPVGDSGTQI